MRYTSIFVLMATILMNSHAFGQVNQLDSQNRSILFPAEGVNEYNTTLSPNITGQIFNNFSDTDSSLTDLIIESQNPNFNVQNLDSIIFGNSLPSERDVGIQLLTNQSLLGNSDATVRLGAAYELGVTGYTDEEIAFEQYMRAAELNNSAAMHSVGRAYLNGFGTSVDFNEAERWIIESYKSGNSLAAVDLAQMYQFGWGNTTNLDLSEQYWKDSISSDLATAYLGYADFLVTHRGLETTNNDVVNLVQAAAKTDDPSAIGLAYSMAKAAGDDKNEQLWVDNLSRLAADGDVASKIELANILSSSDSKYFDLNGAFANYRFATDKGDAFAQAKLGALLLSSPELDPSINRNSAIRLVEGAAARGVPDAFLTLAAIAEESGKGARAFSLATTAGEFGGSQYSKEVQQLQFNTCAKGLVEKCEPVPVFFITNRRSEIANGIIEFGNVPSSDDKLSTGVSLTTIPTTISAKADEKSWSEIAISSISGLFGFDNSEENDQDIDKNIILSELNITPMLQSLKKFGEKNGKERAFIYIHGFANTFDDAATRLALFSEQFKYPGIPILISWASSGESTISISPSGGFTGIGYVNDFRTVGGSCAIFRDVLAKVVDIFGGENVTILAHSMGAQLVDYILSGCPNDSIAWSDSRKFSNLVMAAPDIDAREFDKHASTIVNVVDHFTIYLSANDVALKTSQEMSAKRRRLGQGGPNRYLTDDIMTIDATTVEEPKSGDRFMHSYVFEVSEVKRDLADLLKGETDPNARVCPEEFRDKSTNRPYWALEPRCTD